MALVSAIWNWAARHDEVALAMGNRTKTLRAKDADYGFGRLVDLARFEPGRPIDLVMAVEEYERLSALDASGTALWRSGGGPSKH